MRYPHGVNRKHPGEALLVSAPDEAPVVPAPADAYTGRPFRVVMQIFPDGRCGLAIDGKALWVGHANFFRPAVHVSLAGNSVDTRILVGPLRISTGIAPNIDWKAPNASKR